MRGDESGCVEYRLDVCHKCSGMGCEADVKRDVEGCCGGGLEAGGAEAGGEEYDGATAGGAGLVPGVDGAEKALEAAGASEKRISVDGGK